tara:strand:- start:1507 stop:1632 length:126 start_codon:yes stop_codon:yes gene_type:complete
MWEKTLSEVLEIQEACEMKDAMKYAAYQDDEIKSKQAQGGK